MASHGYGRISISLARRRLRMQYGPVTFRLRHREADVFEIQEDFHGAPIRQGTFCAGPNGTITSVAIAFEALVPAILFRRLIDRC